MDATPAPARLATEPRAALAAALAQRLRESKTELVRRWLDRISARVSLDAQRIFPTNELLNHVPLLIDGIADYLEHADHDLDAAVPVSAKAMELGALRHAQGFDAHEIDKEHAILGAILFSFLTDVADEVDVPAARRDFAVAWRRVSEATELIRQATMGHFLRLAAEKVREREELLRRFNRMVSHELKNHIGAIRGAGDLLFEPWLDAAQRERFQRIITKNAAELQRVLENLIKLTHLDLDSRQQRNVLLPQTAAESVRQLREAAEHRGVEVRIADDLPSVEVDAGAVELCLTNYVSNAIKYSDSAKPARWVEVSGELQVTTPSEPGKLIVRVRDNGIGVPPAARDRLFEQFYRAHAETVTKADGTGLGLSIVRETIEGLGGKTWAEFPEEGGAVFAFSLPSRRQEDAAAAGTHRMESGGGGQP